MNYEQKEPCKLVSFTEYPKIKGLSSAMGIADKSQYTWTNFHIASLMILFPNLPSSQMQILLQWPKESSSRGFFVLRNYKRRV